MKNIKYRLIESEDEIIVILENGGVAEIREAEELDIGDGRQSVTEYYQNRFTLQGTLSDEGIFGEVGEGKLYWNDWKTPFTDPAHIADALNWLAPGMNYVEDNTIWSELK